MAGLASSSLLRTVGKPSLTILGPFGVVALRVIP